MNDDEERRQEQMDSQIPDIASRILKDINRKTRVIILIPGSALTTVDFPKVTLAANDDLLRVSESLSRHGVALVQAEGAMIPVLEQFSQLLTARIYGLTDLPDLSVSPTDQLLTNKYEPLSYHDLALVLDHVKTLTATESAAPVLLFDESRNG